MTQLNELNVPEAKGAVPSIPHNDWIKKIITLRSLRLCGRFHILSDLRGSAVTNSLGQLDVRRLSQGQVVWGCRCKPLFRCP